MAEHDTCTMCGKPAAYHAQGRFKNIRGLGTGLTLPQAFCEEHARSFRHAVPDGMEWLDYPDEEAQDQTATAEMIGKHMGLPPEPPT